MYYTTSGIEQFWPPDDDHMCSKHVNARNKLIIKFSASNYEINYQLDAIEYLFALSSFSSTCFGLTRPSSGAIGVTILTNVAHGVLGCCLVRCRS